MEQARRHDSRKKYTEGKIPHVSEDRIKQLQTAREGRRSIHVSSKNISTYDKVDNQVHNLANSNAQNNLKCQFRFMVKSN